MKKVLQSLRVLPWGLLILALVLTGCQPTAQATPSDVTPAADLPAVVSATGVVVPAQWATLSLAGSGRVAELLVNEGDSVSKDQVLLRLEGSDQLRAALAGAEVEWVAANQNLKTLNDNWEQSRAAAQLRLAQAKDAFDTAEKRRGWKEYRVGNQEQIDIARADLLVPQDRADKAEDAYSFVEDRAEEDLERAALLSALAAARQARDRAARNLNYLLSLPDDIEVAKADAELEVARAEVEAAQRELDKLKDGPDPDLLSLAEARIKNAEAQRQATQSALDDLELKAPFAGSISRLNVRAQEWIAPGQPVLILADLNNLQVETTDLSEIDVARIREGNLADVTFDALPDARVKGGVVRISPKASEGAGVNYTVVVKLIEIPAGLRWGMTAFVDIELVE